MPRSIRPTLPQPVTDQWATQLGADHGETSPTSLKQRRTHREIRGLQILHGEGGLLWTYLRACFILNAVNVLRSNSKRWFFINIKIADPFTTMRLISRRDTVDRIRLEHGTAVDATMHAWRTALNLPLDLLKPFSHLTSSAFCALPGSRPRLSPSL